MLHPRPIECAPEVPLWTPLQLCYRNQGVVCSGKSRNVRSGKGWWCWTRGWIPSPAWCSRPRFAFEASISFRCFSCVFCWFQILILHHPTTIKPNYQAMLHIGSIRQTATLVSMTKVLFALTSWRGSIWLWLGIRPQWSCYSVVLSCNEVSWRCQEAEDHWYWLYRITRSIVNTSGPSLSSLISPTLR